MQVRLKFRVLSIEHGLITKRVRTGDGKKDVQVEVQNIRMAAVYDLSRFWEVHPDGDLRLVCVNKDVAKQFELGKDYYLDFSPAGQETLQEKLEGRQY